MVTASIALLLTVTLIVLPKYVRVMDGSLHIEYGGGFAHYGLIVAPSSQRIKKTSNESYYAEQKLVDHVHFYDTE